MTKAHAYLARIKEQEEDVIAVPDGAGRALCVSSDKHWTITREWDELHVIAPLVEGAAEARTAPAVTKADVEKAVAEWVDDAPEIVNEVWSMVSGSDPAVFVVRESDIAAVEVEQAEGGYWEVNGDLVAMQQNTAEALRGWSLGELQILARYEAVARAIESGCDPVDNPVEEKAKELYESANPGASWDAMVESAGRGNEVDGKIAREYRIIARHILGREATR